MKNIIHIFGASGSGTSTLGRKICKELGYTFMDTDDYFWQPTDPPFTNKRPAEERIQLMKKDIEQSDNAVISGSLTDWGDIFIPYFTLAVRIEMDQAIRIERLCRREEMRFGPRIAPGGDMYSQHMEFIEWAKSYDSGDISIRSKAKHDLWQKLLLCDVLDLDGADTTENNFSKVLSALSGNTNAHL